MSDVTTLSSGRTPIVNFTPTLFPSRSSLVLLHFDLTPSELKRNCCIMRVRGKKKKDVFQRVQAQQRVSGLRFSAPGIFCDHFVKDGSRPSNKSWRKCLCSRQYPPGDRERQIIKTWKNCSVVAPCADPMKGRKENIVRPCARRRATLRALFPRCGLLVRPLKANRVALKANRVVR